MSEILSCPKCGFTGGKEYDFQAKPNPAVNAAVLIGLSMLLLSVGICLGALLQKALNASG